MEKWITYTKETLEKIRRELANTNLIQDEKVSVVVTGSFGREEASSESDMDWFIVVDDALYNKNAGASSQDEVDTHLPKNISNFRKLVNSTIDDHVKKNVGSTGTFGGVVKKTELLTNFGGDKETNQQLTRRMLYVLESTWIYNEEFYNSLKNEIISNYIKDGVDNINKFMLNDIIRYYRTICTDYEYKVYEGGKSWGVRKIKLRFSRKFLYLSGLITIAECYNGTRDERIRKTLELLALPPHSRFKYVFSKESLLQDEVDQAIEIYSKFLNEISKSEVRASLDNISRESRHENEEYNKLKKLSDNFNDILYSCFTKKFDSAHKITKALIF